MDANSGTNSASSGGMTQAQADNLSRIGLPADIVDEIRRANLPDPVLQTLGTVTSPQQLANEVGTLWLQRDLVERIRGVPATAQPMDQARVNAPAADVTPGQGAIYTPPASSPQGNQQPQYTAPPTPPQGYVPPQQGAYPQQQYGQAPEQGQQGQQGAYPQQYPPQQYPPQQQGQYPPQQYQQYPQQGAPPYGQPPYAAPQAQPEKKGTNPLLWVLGGVLLVIVLCVVAVFATLAALGNFVGNATVGFVNSAGGIASAGTFSTYMSSGQYAQARDMLSGDLANRYTEATLQSRWEALVGKNNTLSVNTDLGNPRQDGDRIVVPWTIEGANGKTYNVDLYITSLSSSNQSVMQIVDARPDLIPSP